MRRLISMLAAMVVVAAPLATAGGAVAFEHRDGRGEEQRGRGDGGHWAPGRQAPPSQPYRGGGQEFRGGGGRYERSEPRGDPRGDPRGEFRGEYRGGDQRVDPRYDPRAYGPPPSAYGGYGAAPRRGGYLGSRGGEVIQDYGRYRLRQPPRGYEWVRTPNGMAMVSTMTGQVFDVVPY